MIEETEAVPFDVCGTLPSGVTVLEASAGTGKTYTIAALAARYVAKGVPLERLLLVTFTRMATGELRERVRERLVSVERGLAGPEPSDDPVVALLATGSPDEVRERRDLLARAVADFDAATIATTHGFCQEVLGGLGIAGDLEPDSEFVEDIGDLVEEVVDDLYVRRFFGRDTPPFGRSEVAEIARLAVENPAAEIVAAQGEVPEMRRRLALAVREELELRKRRMAVMTFDDLLTRLDAALEGPDGAATAARLRERFDVVLVDEFQDTDPVQWRIMQRAFGEGDCTLVLIGDPKQAIYAFRGADVYAYLDAARAAGTRATLSVNQRSDQGLIDAYDALFGGAKLGHTGIVYRRVRAAGAHQHTRPPNGAPLRIRVLDRNAVTVTRQGYASNKPAREHIAKDLAGDVVAQLSSGARVRPRDIAVLVQTNRNAALIREALEQAGVPAVINGAGSVFDTDPAQEWLRLLQALERPASAMRAHSAALTCFVGWSPRRIAGAREDDWEDVHRRLHEWARVLRLKGVAALVETITLVEGLPARVLARADGERWLTDLRHVGQLLHAAASADQLGTTALTAWLRRRIAEAKDDTSDEERSRRLESDAEAVQVLTIHRSKGLEFPIVYLPALWEPGYIPDGARPVYFHDSDDARVLDVGLEGHDYDRHREQHVIEQRGEDLRVAYVALTRARHQAIVWWAGSYDSQRSPLTRLLFARDSDGNVAHTCDATPSDQAAWARFAALAEEAQGCIGVEPAALGVPSSWTDQPAPPAHLSAAVFDRALDRRWRRTSYSDITAAAYEARVGSEPEEGVLADEPEEASAVAPDAPRDPALAVPSLLGAMPMGVHVGTLVHRVLEATDFAAPDLDGELTARMAAVQARRAVDVGDTAAAVTGLRAALETPLGPLLGGARLRDVARGDRLDELDFELPLAGGDDPTGSVTLDAVGAVLREHLPAGDPLAGYAERLADPALRQDVRGYLTGSLDLVVRLPGPRFAVVDYKTNWLGGPDEQLTAWHHRPEALAAEMQRHHYGLQALLYTVALHRYLRWRVPGYGVETHIAGVVYLFLRGMTGPGTPVVGGVPCGVFAWRPPRALVEALSDVLSEGAAA